MSKPTRLAPRYLDFEYKILLSAKLAGADNSSPNPELLTISVFIPISFAPANTSFSAIFISTSNNISAILLDQIILLSWFLKKTRMVAWMTNKLMKVPIPQHLLRLVENRSSWPPFSITKSKLLTPPFSRHRAHRRSYISCSPQNWPTAHLWWFWEQTSNWTGLSFSPDWTKKLCRLELHVHIWKWKTHLPELTGGKSQMSRPFPYHKQCIEHIHLKSEWEKAKATWLLLHILKLCRHKGQCWDGPEIDNQGIKWKYRQHIRGDGCFSLHSSLTQILLFSLPGSSVQHSPCSMSDCNIFMTCDRNSEFQALSASVSPKWLRKHFIQHIQQ